MVAVPAGILVAAVGLDVRKLRNQCRRRASLGLRVFRRDFDDVGDFGLDVAARR